MARHGSSSQSSTSSEYPGRGRTPDTPIQSEATPAVPLRHDAFTNPSREFSLSPDMQRLLPQAIQPPVNWSTVASHGQAHTGVEVTSPLDQGMGPGRLMMSSPLPMKPLICEAANQFSEVRPLPHSVNMVDVAMSPLRSPLLDGNGQPVGMGGGFLPHGGTSWGGPSRAPVMSAPLVTAEQIDPSLFDPIYGGLLHSTYLRHSPNHQMNGCVVSPRAYPNQVIQPQQQWSPVAWTSDAHSPVSPFLHYAHGLPSNRSAKLKDRTRNNAVVFIVSLSEPALTTVDEVPSNCFQKNKKMLTVYELSIFRTRACQNATNCKAKRTFSKCPWTHDTPRWKRRNPFMYDYKHLMCPSMQKDGQKNYATQCQAGLSCPYAHSIEEQMYHPHVYKSIPCRNGPQCNKFYCPFLHEGEYQETPAVRAGSGGIYEKVYPYNADPFSHLEKWQTQWNKTPRSFTRVFGGPPESGQPSTGSDSGSSLPPSPSALSTAKIAGLTMGKPFSWKDTSYILEVVQRLGLFTDQHDTLSPLELSIFRTQKCAMKPQCPGFKSPAKCWATHQNISTGRWPRRNPFVVPYRHLMCESVRNGRNAGRAAICSRGESCPNAHSIEEQMYHPYVYKTKSCNNLYADIRCDKHYCPYVHLNRDTFTYGRAPTSPRSTDSIDRLGIYADLWLESLSSMAAEGHPQAAEVLENLPSQLSSVAAAVKSDFRANRKTNETKGLKYGQSNLPGDLRQWPP